MAALTGRMMLERYAAANRSGWRAPRTRRGVCRGSTRPGDVETSPAKGAGRQGRQV